MPVGLLAHRCGGGWQSSVFTRFSFLVICWIPFPESRMTSAESLMGISNGAKPSSTACRSSPHQDGDPE